MGTMNNSMCKPNAEKKNNKKENIFSTGTDYSLVNEDRMKKIRHSILKYGISSTCLKNDIDKNTKVEKGSKVTRDLDDSKRDMSSDSKLLAQGDKSNFEKISSFFKRQCTSLSSSKIHSSEKKSDASTDCKKKSSKQQYACTSQVTLNKGENEVKGYRP